MSERCFMRLTRDDIGPLPVEGEECAWCDEGATHYRVANGDHVCERCYGLAREVGDGYLDVADATPQVDGTQWSWACRRFAHLPRLRFEPPLRFAVSVEGDGCWSWLRADLDDEQTAQLLGLGRDKTDEVEVITGGDRNNLRACIACWFCQAVHDWQEILDEADEDDPECRQYQCERQAQTRVQLEWVAQHVRADFSF